MSTFTKPLHGELTVDAQGHQVCHECYRPCRRLDLHVMNKHGMTLEAYRAEHGIPEGLVMISPAVVRRMKRAAFSRSRTTEGKANLKRATQLSPVIKKPTPPQS